MDHKSDEHATKMSQNNEFIAKPIETKMTHWVKSLITSFTLRFNTDESHFKIATSDEIKNKIYKFRYKIYHKELARDVVGEDIEHKMIKDELDDDPNVILFYQEDNNKIIATMRAMIFRPNQQPQQFLQLYDLDKYPWLNNYTICELSRLMVAKNYRHKLIILRFLGSIVRMLGRKLEVRFIFLTCKPYLVSRYYFLGFRPYTRQMVSYPDGIEIPMFKLIDRSFLKQINSPTRFLFSNSHKINKTHRDEFLNSSTNPIILDQKTLMPLIKNRMLAADFLPFFPKDIKLFQELMKYNCYALIIKYPIELIHTKMVDKTIYLVIDGQVTVYVKNSKPIELGPGHLVGEFAYFLPKHKRTARVMSENSILFVIKESALNELMKHHKVLYIKFINFIIQNLIYKILIGNDNLKGHRHE